MNTAVDGPKDRRYSSPTVKVTKAGANMPAPKVQIPAKPTNADLADAIRELHDCVEISHELVMDKVDKVGNRVSVIEGYNAAMSVRLGITANPEISTPSQMKKNTKPMIGFLKPVNGLWMGAIAVAAGSGAYKIIVALAIAGHQALLALK